MKKKKLRAEISCPFNSSAGSVMRLRGIKKRIREKDERISEENKILFPKKYAVPTGLRLNIAPPLQFRFFAKENISKLN
jgi:hypothetical protein